MNAITAPFTRERLAAAAQKLRCWLLLGLAVLAELFDDTPFGVALRLRARAMVGELELFMKVRLVLLDAANTPRTARRSAPLLAPFVARRGFRRHERRGSVLLIR